MNKVLQWVIVVLIVIIAAAGAFYGGIQYGKNQAQAAPPAARADGAYFGRGMNAGEGGNIPQGMPFPTPGAGPSTAGFIAGQIQEIRPEGEVIVQTNDGRTLTVRVTDTTLIEKNMSVSVNDLENGETVLVSGDEDNGVITARSLQVMPEGRVGFGAREPGAQ